MSYEILKPESIRDVKGVLFDMDGVVLDTETLYTRFWIEAAKELGFNMSWEQSLGMRSLNRKLGQQYLESCFGKNANYMQMREIRIKRMNAFIDEHGVEPKKGIYELLDYLHDNNILCAITTSSPQERIKNHLTPLGLYDKFDKICSGYEVKNGKPAPDIYLYGAKSIGINPENCLAVEDSPTGIKSASSAKCMSVIVPDLDEPNDETLSMSFARADDLSELIAMIEKINK